MKLFFDFPEELEVVNGDVADKVITLTVVSTQTAPCCPLCGTSASRIHSQYSRQLTDMPCAGQRVRLILHVRKFFCDETTCVRKILMPYRILCNAELQISLEARTGLVSTHSRFMPLHKTRYGVKIFAERLAPFIQPWARVTTRFFQAVENIGLATSGMLGARLGHRLGMQTSWDAIPIVV